MSFVERRTWVRPVVLLCVASGCSDGGDLVDAGARRDVARVDAAAGRDVQPGSDAAVDPCRALGSCGQCAGASGCGWCGTRSQCLSGSASSSSDGSCSGPAWDFTGDLCTSDTDSGTPPGDSGAPPGDAGHTGPCVPTVGHGGEDTNALCANGIDDDCNGYVDCNDYNCSRNPSVSVCSGGGGRDAGAVDAGGGYDAGPAGPIGPTGGSVGLLHFGVFGDVRPPNPNETSSYPTMIIDEVMSGMRGLGAQFGIASGDYMFADSASAVTAQLGLFVAAEATFGGYVFHSMGNHECTGATNSNCPNGNETPNVTSYMSMLNAGHAHPYFDWTITTSMGAAHFIAAAPNAWSSAQQSWLTSALAMPAAYTFVIAHEPPSGTTGPGSAAIDRSIAARSGGVTMVFYGHTHEFRHLSTNAVIDGNAGAPLSSGSSSDDYYGFGVVDQRPDGNIVFTAYEVGSPPMVHESFVVTPAGGATH